jgi:hypothetical protein
MNIKGISITVVSGILITLNGFGQGSSKANFNDFTGSDDGNRVIQTPVSFLNIAPESRGGSMGDAGVATPPDASSMHWNPAKYAFIKEDDGLSLSYSPWLKNLASDIHLLYLSSFNRFSKYDVGAVSLRYFSLGEIMFRDVYNMPIGQHTPNELAIDGAYSRLFSENFSMGVAFRFIYSNLSSGISVSEVSISKPGMAVAADVSAYYHRKLNIKERESDLAFGLNISNIGNKIKYSDDDDGDFIPTNLRLGTALTSDIDKFNTLTFTVDINKLLVPTPPVYAINPETGEYYLDANDNKVIAKGYSDKVSLTKGMIQSFYDAPGGFKEELKEYMISFGTEYWYSKQFALRGGYFNENVDKGNRKYFTLGVGLRMNVFNIDFSYLVPTTGRSNPLANTMRFTLGFNMNRQKKIKKDA